jgi:HSP20 family protein
MRLIPSRGEQWGLFGLQDRMNNLFEAFSRGNDWTAFGEGTWPTVDVIETPETLQVKAEMPGIDPKDIEIAVHGDTLTIRGEKKTEEEHKGKTWHRRERTAGMIARTIHLPVAIDPDHIDAVDEAGVLTVTLPKREDVKPRQITVRTK